MSNGAPIFIYTHQQTKQELAKVILHESKPNADTDTTKSSCCEVKIYEALTQTRPHQHIASAII